MLIVLQWNARSLISNGQEFKKFISDMGNKPHIICIQETWLKPQLDFVIQGYTAFRNDREERNQTQVLRQQQDEAYLASLRADQEKERKKREEQEQLRQEEEKVRQSVLVEERKRRVSGFLLDVVRTDKTCCEIT